MKRESVKGMSRRDFAKASAAAGLAALAAGAYAAEPAGAGVLKVGLLGCGSRGTGALRDMFRGNENVKVIALGDTFADKIEGARKSVTEEFKERADIQDDHCFVGLDAYKQIIETDIDILIEGTLPYCRPKHVEAAVNAKKHIFTEKPVAVDPAGIHQFIAAANKAQELGLSLVAGTQRRHQKSYVETIARIHAGEIGEVMALRAYWCGGLPFAHDRKPEWSDLEYCIRNWYAHCWVCGDNIVEQHVHNLDVCNWIMSGFGCDHPVSVFSSGGRAFKPNEPKYGDLWDNFSCDFEYANGVRMLSVSRHWDKLDGGVFEEATGSRAKNVRCNSLGQDDISPYVQEHINLIKSITGEGPYLNEGVQVAYSTMTAIMGRISAYTGRTITWEDVMTGKLADYSIVPEVLDFGGSYPPGPVPVPGKVGLII